MKKDIGSVLKESRIKSGISVKQISDILTNEGYKASEKTIYSWESGNSQPSPDILLKLCDIYEINDILSTFGYNGYNSDGRLQLNLKETSLIEKYRTLDDFSQETINLVLDRECKIAEQINNYKEQLKSRPNNIIEFSSPADDSDRLVKYYHGVSAGSGVFIMGNEVVDQIAIPDTPDNRNVDYAISVTGNSMEPDFYEGDIALVSQKEEMRFGDVGIFVVNGSAYIKEYDEFELISRNPDVANIEISEYDNIVCMGKVIGKISSSASVLSPEDEEALLLARNLLEQKKKTPIKRRRK